MDARGAGKFWIANRLWILIITLFLLLTVSVCWNVRQNRLIAKARQRTLAAEDMEITHARERAEALKKKNAKWAGSDARLQELYREIDTLSRLNEQVLSYPKARLKKPVTIDNPAETLSAP